MSETTTSAPPHEPAPPAADALRRRDRARPVRIAAWVALVVVLLALPLYIGPGLQSAGQYVMIGGVGAIGLTLVIGQAGQLSLAHAFFLLVGATAYAVLAGETEQAGAEYVVGLGLPPLVALIGAVVISGLAGLAVAPIAGRLKGIYLGVASLALVFLGFYLGQALPELTGGAASGRNPTPFSLFGFSFSNEGYLAVLGVPFRQSERLWYLFLALTAISYLLARGAVGSRVGRSWRAVRDNEAAAAVMGVNVLRAKAGAFAVSASRCPGLRRRIIIGPLAGSDGSYAARASGVVRWRPRRRVRTARRAPPRRRRRRRPAPPRSARRTGRPRTSRTGSRRAGRTAAARTRRSRRTPPPAPNPARR